MTTPERRLARWRTTYYLVWSIIGICLLLAAAGWVLGRLTGALIPFFIGFMIAFLLHTPVAALERRGLHRIWAVLICFLVGLAALVVAGIFLFPPLGRELQAFATQVPVYLDQAAAYLQEQQTRFSQLVLPGWVQNAMRSIVGSIGSFVSRLAESAGRLVLAAGSGVVVGLFDLLVGTVVGFWILKDMPTMRDELIRVVGPRFESDAENLLITVNRMVGGYLKGQTIASLTTGALVTVGLAVIGVPYALVLGLVTFVFNYVPYIGPFLGGVAAAVVGLFVSPLTAVLAIVIVIVAQNLTDSLVTPRVMSAQVSLHPTIVIFSILVGGALFGIMGMLLAIPFAATAKGLFVYYYERRTKRQLESAGGAFFPSGSGEADEGASEGRGEGDETTPADRPEEGNTERSSAEHEGSKRDDTP